MPSVSTQMVGCILIKDKPTIHPTIKDQIVMQMTVSKEALPFERKNTAIIPAAAAVENKIANMPPVVIQIRPSRAKPL